MAGISAIRNLDVVLPGTIEIHTSAKTYRLRDDIGAVLGLLGYRIQALAAAMPNNEEAAATPVAEILARNAAFSAELLAACGALFRHTYPAMTDEEVAEALPSDALRMALVTVFFTTRFAPSGPPPHATPVANPPASIAAVADAEPSAARPAEPPSSPAATSKSKRSSKRG